LFSHFLLAHAESFFRDIARLDAAATATDACPMGSGALAGCTLDLDRRAIARELGFARPTANSLDAASDRDFALDYLYALAVIATHLSRLSEAFVLFASQEFGFIVLPDEFSTGSSLMPQKKNPDAWELLRGKTGRVTASLHTLLTTLKGLPSSYQRDLQEDKEPVFGAHDQVVAMLSVAAGAISATRPNEARMREAASDPALLATEAAHYLVRKGAPFRQAHEIVGQIVVERVKRRLEVLRGRPRTRVVVVLVVQHRVRRRRSFQLVGTDREVRPGDRYPASQAWPPALLSRRGRARGPKERGDGYQRRDRCAQ